MKLNESAPPQEMTVSQYFHSTIHSAILGKRGGVHIKHPKYVDVRVSVALHWTWMEGWGLGG
jgi:hypothetical protein